MTRNVFIQLKYRSGSLAGQLYSYIEPELAPLPAPLRLGRHPDAYIRPLGDDESMVSRNHAELHYKDSRLSLLDVGSTHGVYVAGSRERTEQLDLQLGEGRDIRLGASGPIFHISLGAAIPFGPYLLVGKLGEGGMGEVYVGWDSRLSRLVALKLLIMCGCGRIYHPLCPECGRHLLQRRDVENKDYPSLACPDSGCGYEVSAMNIEIQYKKLTSPPAKTCCKEGPRATEGTIINFVNRPAVIMDLQEIRFDEVAEQRRTYFHQRCQQYLTEATETSGHGQFGKWRKARDQLRLQRAMALDKMMMRVQVAEAVAGLHQELGIIHKDLTPDNVMVNFNTKSSQGGQQKKTRPRDFQELLNDLVSYPTFGVKIIDFGLADRQKLSRKWYEEKDIINAGMDKAPYFSPEALQRTQRLNHRLHIDLEHKRFLIPPELKNSIISVHEGDVLTFQWDLLHKHELLIKRIEAGAEPGSHYAYFEGQPPSPEQQRQSQLVLPLGEAYRGLYWAQQGLRSGCSGGGGCGERS